LRGALRFGPGLRGGFRDLAVGHAWQSGQNFAEIRVGIEAASAAAFDDGVNDGAAFARFGLADEEPVFLFMASSS